MADLETRQNDFKKAWSRFATGVAVITTVEPGGQVHGMTANGVTSVSLDPPLALASVGHERNTHGLIESTGRFGISILKAGQAHIARHYTLPHSQRPADVRVRFDDLGATPVVAGALAAMACTVVAAHPAGDHTIFVAEVEAHSISEGNPLLWYMGRFGELRLDPETPIDGRD